MDWFRTPCTRCYFALSLAALLLPRSGAAQTDSSAAALPAAAPAPPADSLFHGIVTYRIRVTGARAKGLEGLLPHTQTTTFRAGAVRMATRGGIYPVQVLRDTSGQTYLLDSARQVAHPLPPLPADIRVVKTRESASILGYWCRKYTVSQRPAPGKPYRVTHQIWAAARLRLSPGDGLPAAQLFPGIPYLPLRVIVTETDLGLTLEAVRVQPQDLPPDAFALPSAYSRAPFDRSRLLGGMYGLEM